jgi:hypothetical protein
MLFYDRTHRDGSLGRDGVRSWHLLKRGSSGWAAHRHRRRRPRAGLIALMLSLSPRTAVCRTSPLVASVRFSLPRGQSGAQVGAHRRGPPRFITEIWRPQAVGAILSSDGLEKPGAGSLDVNAPCPEIPHLDRRSRRVLVMRLRGRRTQIRRSKAIQ